MIDYTKTPDKDLQVATDKKGQYSKFKFLIAMNVIIFFLFDFYQKSKDLIISLINEYNEDKILFIIIISIIIIIGVYSFRLVK